MGAALQRTSCTRDAPSCRHSVGVTDIGIDSLGRQGDQATGRKMGDHLGVWRIASERHIECGRQNARPSFRVGVAADMDNTHRRPMHLVFCLRIRQVGLSDQHPTRLEKWWFGACCRPKFETIGARLRVMQLNDRCRRGDGDLKLFLVPGVARRGAFKVAPLAVGDRTRQHDDRAAFFQHRRIDAHDQARR
ncbi:hypothetical protein XAC3810_60053 [Xanthomonas citri pv. citri]|nr:hypothetical protein XAC3810_60053 [Xanthomonas citri pv. citri]